MILQNYIRGITYIDAIFQEVDVNRNLFIEENLSDDETNQLNQIYCNEIDNLSDYI